MSKEPYQPRLPYGPYRDFDESPEDLAAWRKEQERRRLQSMTPYGQWPPSPGSHELCSIDEDGNATDSRLHEGVLSAIDPADEAQLLEVTCAPSFIHR